MHIYIVTSWGTRFPGLVLALWHFTPPAGFALLTRWVSLCSTALSGRRYQKGRTTVGRTDNYRVDLTFHCTHGCFPAFFLLIPMKLQDGGTKWKWPCRHLKLLLKKVAVLFLSPNFCSSFSIQSIINHLGFKITTFPRRGKTIHAMSCKEKASCGVCV